ncbi:MAG: hypothetical protein K2O18_13615, partial [Oscillospiraceae bacterium]|nr:hypothetical protein [Oscillospiraceae bacterium]
GRDIIGEKRGRRKEEMAEMKEKCPYCGSEEVSLYGKNRTGRQRYLCRNKACRHKTLLGCVQQHICIPFH